MQEVKVGFIGAGGIMAYHVRGLRAIAGVRLVGAYDVNHDNLHSRCREFGLAPYENVEDLLASDVDAVFVIAPAFAHAQHCVAAARAGKDIFCEKPLALNLVDADLIIAAARQARVKLMVGFNNNFRPVTRQLRAMFDLGELGRLVTVWDRQFMYREAGFWIAKHGKLDKWRLHMELSGGRMTEFGSHKINWAQFIGGQPLSIYGRMDTVAETLGKVDDTDLAVIAFERGYANIEISLSPAAINAESVGIMGDRGCARWDGGEIVRLRRNRSPAVEEVAVSTEGETVHEHFVRCLRDDLEPEVNGESGRLTVRICEAFVCSAGSGQAVELT